MQLQELLAEEIQAMADDDTNNVLADSILSEIKQPLPNSSSNCCIFRVPDKLRAVKEEAYVPEIVSIGPFHRGKPNLQSMEQHKKRYLKAFLSRISTTSSSSSASEYSKSSLLNLKDLIKSMRELEAEARECYPDIINLSSDEFVQMMLLDGCFVVEFLLRDYDYTNGLHGVGPSNDQIFGTTWMIISLVHDLVLLENQIPFAVLDTIFSFTYRDHEHGDPSLDYLVFSCIARTIPTFRAQVPEEISHVHEEVSQVQEEILQVQEEISKNQVELLSFSTKRPKHILDWLHSFLLPLSQQKVDDSENNLGKSSEDSERCCATDMWEAGVTFKLKEQQALDVQFNDKDGIFEMPFLSFNEKTVVSLRNLVAMEQYDSNSTQLVSSYVALLCRLIKSDKDVRLLRRNKIVENHWINDKEMVVTIKSLNKDVIMSNHYHGEVQDRCSKYIKTRGRKWRTMLKRDHFNIKWQEWKEKLKRDYFHSPWAVLSFIAAVLLLSFTFLQTFYTIFAYHQRSSSSSS